MEVNLKRNSIKELILILSSLDLELVIGLKAFLQERNYILQSYFSAPLPNTASISSRFQINHKHVLESQEVSFDLLFFVY